MRSERSQTSRTTPRRWLRFAAALIVFAGFTGVFMSGVTPPGICGEVLRHNQAHDIDASPLFYSEVEHMSDLESGVRDMRRTAASRQPANDSDKRIPKGTNAQSH